MVTCVHNIFLPETGYPVFIGKDQGQSFRNFCNLDSLDATDECVFVVIPLETFAVTTSYFKGLFYPSLIAAGGPLGFFDKFKFEGPPHIIESLRRTAEVVWVEYVVLSCTF